MKIPTMINQVVDNLGLQRRTGGTGLKGNAQLSKPLLEQNCAEMPHQSTIVRPTNQIRSTSVILRNVLRVASYALFPTSAFISRQIRLQNHRLPIPTPASYAIRTQLTVSISRIAIQTNRTVTMDMTRNIKSRCLLVKSD